MSTFDNLLTPQFLTLSLPPVKTKMRLSLLALLGLPISSAATPTNPLNLLNNFLTTNLAGTADGSKSGSAEDFSELKEYYKKCEGFTEKLVCDFLRNEAVNKGLTPLEVR